jgi:hypothetical protein
VGGRGLAVAEWCGLGTGNARRVHLVSMVVFKNRGSASMNAGPPGLGACLDGTALAQVVFSVASHAIFISSLDFMSWSNDTSVRGY